MLAARRCYGAVIKPEVVSRFIPKDFWKQANHMTVVLSPPLETLSLITYSIYSRSAHLGDGKIYSSHGA